MNKGVSTKEVLSHIIRSLRHFSVSIFVMFWVAIIWSIDLSLRPYILKIILNRLSDESQPNILNHLLGPILLYLILYFILITSYRLYGYFVEIHMVPNIRKKVADIAFGLLLEKSHRYYQNNLSGNLTNKVIDLMRGVPEIVQIVIDRFFAHALALIIAIVTLFYVNMLFALFMIVWTFLAIIAALLFWKRLAYLADHWSECGSIITGTLVNVLTNILSVRLFATRSFEKKSFHDLLQKTVVTEQQLQWSYFWMWMLYSYSFFMLQVLNFYFLCKGRQEGWITVGDFALVLVLNLSIVDFLWNIAKEFSQFSKLYGRITQAFTVLLEPSEITDKKGAKNLEVPKGEISFDQVKFYYNGTEPFFQNKSVIIKAQQKVGLVGYSGGGKSTFVNLILRLYDVSSGHILIDEQDIRDVSQDSLRENIGIIPQDPSLFNRTVMENIRYGRINASDEEVIEAAKKAHAHEFIVKLSHGYNTLVGERGIKLSGGQRQRILIARAILKNAPILILDEATSQLDAVTESKIQDSLWELMQGKTSLVIAHRLSTLLHMDRILVFEQGKIIEDGSHSELLQKNGLYKNLWDAQIGGFLPDQENNEE